MYIKKLQTYIVRYKNIHKNIMYIKEIFTNLYKKIFTNKIIRTIKIFTNKKFIIENIKVQLQV